MRRQPLLRWFSHCLLIIIPLLAHGTIVGGLVEGIWTPAGNPYDVASTLIIDSNRTLIIKPGVEVNFFSSDSIKVYGTLVAEGTEEDSIYFIDNGKGCWRGIWFMNGSSSNSSIEYAYISQPLWGIVAQYSHPKISKSTIFAQTVGVWGSYSFLTLEDCLVDVEAPKVEGVRLFQSPAQIRGCTINAKNAINVYNAVGIRITRSNPEISATEIHVSGEGLSCGILLENSDKPFLVYNLIHVYSNSLAYGAFINGCLEATFINNTIVVKSDHTADKCVYIWESSNPIIENCILYGDGSSQGVVAMPSCYPELLYTDIYNHFEDLTGCTPGPGCTFLDPRFLDPELKDYHLQSSSPCIDTGNPSSPYNPDSTMADMGCFYFPHYTGFIDDGINQPISYPVLNAYPNPFNLESTIRISLPQSSYGSLAVYNTGGCRVCTLHEGFFEIGSSNFEWNAEAQSSGNYWIVLQLPDRTSVFPIVLL
ncbi:MAG: right-handed parallel beta-helix repeat-containing protein, partial [Chloroflexota bacterium]